MTERRRERRAAARELQGIAVCVRPGHRVVVVDLSPSGALIEASKPLRPGSRVQVQLEAGHASEAVGARVLRCLVAAVDGERGVTYRAALAFEERCSLVREPGARDGYVLPEEHGRK